LKLVNGLIDGTAHSNPPHQFSEETAGITIEMSSDLIVSDTTVSQGRRKRKWCGHVARSRDKVSPLLSTQHTGAAGGATVAPMLIDTPLHSPPISATIANFSWQWGRRQGGRGGAGRG